MVCPTFFHFPLYLHLQTSGKHRVLTRTYIIIIIIINIFVKRHKQSYRGYKHLDYHYYYTDRIPQSFCFLLNAFLAIAIRYLISAWYLIPSLIELPKYLNSFTCSNSIKVFVYSLLLLKLLVRSY